MSYRYVVTATIVSLQRSRDDVASGMLRLEAAANRTLVGPDGLSPFITRRSTVAACRRHYKAAAWRPEQGDRVLIDGEFDDSGVLIDAIAPDLAPHFPAEGLASLAATALAEQAASLGAAHKLFRQDPGAPLRRIRCVQSYLETDRGTALPAIAHLDVDLRDGRMRVWSICAEGRGLVASTLTPALEDTLAAVAGITDMPRPLVPGDHLIRRQGSSTRSLGGLSERPRRQAQRYRPGASLEAALRKAGLEHSAFDDEANDVPFDEVPVTLPPPAQVDGLEENDCPF